MLRIMLDGKLLTEGYLEDELIDQLEEDPNFDPNRLSYHPEDLQNMAVARVTRFASKTRGQVMQNEDAMHRDALFLKGVMAAQTLAILQPDIFKKEIAPAVVQSFGAEAELRGLDENPVDLMKASVEKMLRLLGATCMVEGFAKQLFEGIEDASPDSIEEFLNNAERNAEGMKDQFGIE